MSVILKSCGSAFPCMKLEYIFWEDWFQLLTDSLESRLLCGLCHQHFVCSNKLFRLPATGSSAEVLPRKKYQSLLPFLNPYLLDKPTLCPAAPLLGHDAIEQGNWATRWPSQPLPCKVKNFSRNAQENKFILNSQLLCQLCWASLHMFADQGRQRGSREGQESWLNFFSN